MNINAKIITKRGQRPNIPMGLYIYVRELEKVTKEGVITGLVKNKNNNNCEYCGAGLCRVRTAQHCWVLTGSRVIIGAKIRFFPLVENK